MRIMPWRACRARRMPGMPGAPGESIFKMILKFELQSELQSRTGQKSHLVRSPRKCLVLFTTNIHHHHHHHAAHRHAVHSASHWLTPPQRGIGQGQGRIPSRAAIRARAWTSPTRQRLGARWRGSPARRVESIRIHSDSGNEPRTVNVTTLTRAELSVFAHLSWLDRLLGPLVLLAMILGVVIGEGNRQGRYHRQSKR